TTQRELVKWAEPDSAMEALMSRSGFNVTRYQGDQVVFDAKQRELRLNGNAAIQRGETILVGDTVTYNDSTERVIARGDTVILRDPSQGTADLIATGRIEYSVAQRAGIVTGLCTAVPQGGETWYVCGEQSGFRTDSVAGEQRRTLFSHEGIITSCDLKEPHYHFASKDVKVIQNRLLVARPAVLYIRDIPVMWLPFIFQDMRSGRRSGFLSPRIGLSDIVPTSSSYRRQIENVGYYFALSDYYDATLWFDWRSGARRTDVDPGWMRWNGEFRYRWLDRFMRGGLFTRYENFTNGSTNYQIGWRHDQEFSRNSRVNADLNYTKSTTLYQQQAFNVATALATIASRLNYSYGLGPLSFQAGGSRTQYSGRDQVQQDFPNINVSSRPIQIADWMVWSPGLAVTNSQTFNVEGGTGIQRFRYSLRPDGTLDSAQIKRDTRNSTLSFQTPLRIFGFTWQNSISVRDFESSIPEIYPKFYLNANDTSQYTNRVFSKGFSTEVDWQTGFSLPPLFRGTWNLTPSVSIVNATSGPFMVRNVRTGDTFVRQGKRLEYGLSAAPTLFGFFPGFGPFSRIRQSIQPTFSYRYAPRANISDEFLLARNQTRVGYLGGLQQNLLSLGLRTEFEAKLKSAKDTTPGGGEKLRLLSLDFTPLSYDFERARTGASGITSTTFGWSARSDLLPGFDLSVGYSLFEGNPISDTARFKPYRTDIQATFSIGRDRNPFATLTRVFGRAAAPSTNAIADTGSAPPPDVEEPGLATRGRDRFPLGLQTGRGWSASFTFSSNRSRPLRGGENVQLIDPAQVCARFQSDPLLFQECQRQAQLQRDTIGTSLEGGVVTRYPAQSTLRGSFGFDLTPNWGVQWLTGYDFTRHEFSDHTVTLQRELHDWRAIFAFTQAPNGNFAFNFYITLKAQPDIKFDYNRRTYRPSSGP
ncbi:MAG TPA: putative LPS assembly protein LptD, partial [Gemmatimonadaceae bacterium]|nr:putative LPS assembly protein LptD [Gemmatimonadaceae bacterium]